MTFEVVAPSIFVRSILSTPVAKSLIVSTDPSLAKTNLSMPAPPISVSLPLPPVSVSLPAPASRTFATSLPCRMSLPAPVLPSSMIVLYAIPMLSVRNAGLLVRPS